jgi:hypothetical protein
MMAMRGLLAMTLSGVIVLGAVHGRAQEQVDITAPSPPRRAPEPIVIPPGDHGEATRPSDADYYPQSPKVRHAPAFVGPLSVKTESARGTGRLGLTGWTAPGTPVGAALTGHREVSGWFAFGFTYEWNGPPPPGTPATRPIR